MINLLCQTDIHILRDSLTYLSCAKKFKLFNAFHPSHLIPLLGWSREKHLSIIMVARNCATLLWYAELTSWCHWQHNEANTLSGGAILDIKHPSEFRFVNIAKCPEHMGSDRFRPFSREYQVLYFSQDGDSRRAPDIFLQCFTGPIWSWGKWRHIFTIAWLKVSNWPLFRYIFRQIY